MIFYRHVNGKGESFPFKTYVLLCFFPQFGGKLITFENPKQAPVQSPQPVPRQVFMSQVTTETEFLQRSRELQAALQSGSFNNYCQAKIQNAKSDAEQDIWKFLLVGPYIHI